MNLIQSLQTAIKYKIKHDDERANCQSDCSYFGHHETRRMEEAEQEFKTKLDDYIEQKVKDTIDKYFSSGYNGRID